MNKILLNEATVKLVLAALDHCKDVIVERGLNGNPEFAKRWGLTLPLQRSEEAITALREALAEQPAQQEPVAKLFGTLPIYDRPAQQPTVFHTQDVPDPLATIHPELYRQTWNALHPDMALAEQPAQPAQQEPVAWTLLLVSAHKGLVGEAGNKFAGAPADYPRVDVYTTPQQARPAQPKEKS